MTYTRTTTETPPPSGGGRVGAAPGNVMVILSDHKKGIDMNTNMIVDYYEPILKSTQDYYPGGMLMPGRSYSSNAYRFGYQGSLKDDEISGSGNEYSTFFRELDVRSLRWWGCDPKTSASPWESPYMIMGGNPILNIDPFGDVLTKFKDSDGNLLHETKDGNDQTVTVDDKKVDEFKKEVSKIKPKVCYNIQTEKKLTIDLASKYMKEGQAMMYNKDKNGNIGFLSFYKAPVNLVHQVGIRVTGGIGTAFTMAGGVTWDNKGNVGLYGSAGGGYGVDGSIGMEYVNSYSYSNNLTINSLNGQSGTYNFSGGTPLVGMDVSTGGNLDGNNVFSKTGSQYSSNGFGISISPFIVGGTRTFETMSVIRIIKAK